MQLHTGRRRRSGGWAPRGSQIEIQALEGEARGARASPPMLARIAWPDTSARPCPDGSKSGLGRDDYPAVWGIGRLMASRLGVAQAQPRARRIGP